jgi:hypothetical protein
MLSAKRFAPMNARDKMPFEVTPIYFKLQRYEDAQKAPAPVPGTAPAATPAGNSGEVTPPPPPAAQN